MADQVRHDATEYSAIAYTFTGSLVASRLGMTVSVESWDDVVYHIVV
ncbi:hypothetical protein [Fibrobacter sp.]